MALQPAKAVCQQTAPCSPPEPDLRLPAHSTEMNLQAALSAGKQQWVSVIINAAAVVTKGVRVCLWHLNLPICLFFLCCVCPGLCVYTGRSWTQQDSILFSVPCCVSRYEGINIWKAEEALCPQLLWPEVCQPCISCTFYQWLTFPPPLPKHRFQLKVYLTVPAIIFSRVWCERSPT